MQICLKHDLRHGKKGDVADYPKRLVTTVIGAIATKQFDDVVASLDEARANQTSRETEAPGCQLSGDTRSAPVGGERRRA